MRVLTFILAIFATANQPTFAFDELFSQAQTEYDNGQYEQA